MGDFEAMALALVESTLKYHPYTFWILTVRSNPSPRQSMVGSLTGAVASQKVTEDYEGSLGPVGNRAIERMSIRELYCETNKSSSCESRFK